MSVSVTESHAQVAIDSVALVTRAKQALDNFEQVAARAALPAQAPPSSIATGPGSFIRSPDPRCDPVSLPCLMGRAIPCFTCGHSPVSGPVYHAALIETRSALGSVLQAHPGDRWAAGQLAYLSARYGADTAQSNPPCAATTPPGWCELLAAYVATTRTGYSTDSVFARALDRLAPEWRCGWMDMALLIRDQAQRARYANMACADRLKLEKHVWWLADPSFLINGNDRWVAHATRRVYQALYEDWKLGSSRLVSTEARTSRDRAKVSRSVTDTIVTNGWYDAFERAVRTQCTRKNGESVCETSLGSVRGRIADAGYSFLPPYAAWSKPIEHLSAADLNAPLLEIPPALYTSARAQGLNRPSATVPPVESYSPPYGPVWALEDYQIARFERSDGDSMEIVAAFQTDRDSVRTQLTAPRASRARRNTSSFAPFGGANWTAGLFAGNGPDADQHRIFTTTGAYSEHYVLQVRVPAAPQVVGIELLAAGEKGLARARIGLDALRGPPQRFTVSDLLLFDPPQEWTSSRTRSYASLDSVRPHMSGTLQRPPGDVLIGFYWELSGVEPSDSVINTIAVRRTDASFLSALGRTMGVARSPGVVQVEWAEASDRSAPLEMTSPPHGRWIAISIRTLAPGDYRLTLTSKIPGQLPVSAERQIRILR